MLPSAQQGGIVKTDSRIFVGLSSFQALAMFRRGIFYTFLAVYLRSNLGLSVTETTLFETIPMILNVLFQTFVWGRLTDHLQRRRSLIITGELLASVGHVVMWYAHASAPSPRASGFAIIAGLTIIEIFWSMSNIGWSAYISDVYTPQQRNAVQGRLASIGGVGRMIGAMAGGLLYDGARLMYPGWGFRSGGIFFVASFVMLVSVIPLFFMPEGGIRYRAAEEAPTADDRSARGGIGRFIMFLAAMLLINSGVNTVSAFRAQYMNLPDGFAASAGTISLAANAESAALIVVGFFLGMLGKRLGIGRLLLFGATMGIVSLVLLALAPSVGLVLAAALFKGLSDGCVASSSYAYASTLIPPEKRGRYFALYNATFFLSWGLAATFVTGPLIDSLLLSGTGAVAAYRAGFVSGAGLVSLGLALLVALNFVTRRSARVPKTP